MVAILSTCDIWKSTSSMRLVGVYTSKKKLGKDIRELLRDERIELGDGCKMPKQIRGIFR